jgi:hypothetical protein
MAIRSSRRLAATAAILLTLVIRTGAAADPPRASKDHWRNIDYPSHYILYDPASHTYVETVDCRPLYRFTLQANEANQLTLYDASRNMTVRINYEGMWLKESGAANFTFYQRGTFDRRTLFEHVDASGAHTGSIIKRDGCRWEEHFPGGSGPGFVFTQAAVTADTVDLYDRSRDMTVRLDATRMWLRQGSAPLAFFKNGRWRR